MAGVPHECKEFVAGMVFRVKAVPDGHFIGYLAALYYTDIGNEGHGERHGFAVLVFCDQMNVVILPVGLSFQESGKV
ncbi:hypothetical protein [Shigella flexneri]|uniref:hypothetical protein n=1 Tax=Shigella flexneri TaxID=623 RepID=UPI0005B64293|nr:hypothetical protein [Shigella flexneri]